MGVSEQVCVSQHGQRRLCKGELNLLTARHISLCLPRTRTHIQPVHELTVSGGDFNQEGVCVCVSGYVVVSPLHTVVSHSSPLPAPLPPTTRLAAFFPSEPLHHVGYKEAEGSQGPQHVASTASSGPLHWKQLEPD